MTPSAMLTLMQECTNMHMQQLYPCLEDFRDIKRQAFVLSKLYLRFHKPVSAYDDIEISTWTGTESKGFTFWRSFSAQHKGETVADALSHWALIDLEANRLLPVSAFENDFEDEPSVDIEIPRRIKFPEAELSIAGTKIITYSDIDYNLHMNNTHYPNMLLDYLPSPEKYRVKEMMLSFVLGSMYNDEIKIYRSQQEDNQFYFRTVNAEGKTCLEAVLTVEERQGEIK